MRDGLVPYAILLVMGAGWGLSQPMTKIAVSGGYGTLGLTAWQLIFSCAVLGTILILTGRGWPRGRRGWTMCLAVSVFGNVLPGICVYVVARHLPAGVVSLMLSMVPMLAFPVALLLGTDRFGAARLAGLLCGLAGVALIALPQSSLPDPEMAVWLPLALVAPGSYAVESNIVARWGTGGLDPVQLLFGASFLGLCVVLPAALISGQWIDPRPPWGAPQAAFAISATINAMVYSAYVWLIGRAGSVFAAQVSYLVTGAGVLWAMLILGERYSGWIWAAFAILLAGMALVRPRQPAQAQTPSEPLAEPAGSMKHPAD